MATAEPRTTENTSSPWRVPSALGPARFTTFVQRIVRSALGSRGLDVLSLLPTIVVFCIAAAAMQRNPFGWDEQIFVWCGWSVTKGMIPYRDFIDFKPPMIPLMHALGFLFGTENFRFRIFFAGFALTAIIATQLALLSRRVNRILAAALMVGVVCVFANHRFHDSSLSDTESIGMGFYLLGVAALIAATKYPKVATAFGCAMFTGCVLSKEPYGACVIPTWIACFFAVPRDGGRWKSALEYAKWSVAGVAAAVLLLGLWMVPTGALKHYIAMINWYRPLLRDSTSSYCVQLNIFKPTTTLQDIPRYWEIISERFFNLETVGFLAPFFIASAIFITRRSVLLLAATIASFIGGLIAVVPSLCFWKHYFVMAMAGTFLVLIVGLVAMAADPLVSNPRVQNVIAGCVALVVALHVGSFLETIPTGATHNEGPDPEIVSFVRKNSTRKDRIFTTGPPALYFLANRRHAVRMVSGFDEFLAVLPGATDAEKLAPLRAELEASRPKIVYFDPEHQSRKKRHVKAAYVPFLKSHHYVEVRKGLWLRPDPVVSN